MRVRRTNPVTRGMGCTSCSSEPDCYMSANSGYSSASNALPLPTTTVNTLSSLGTNGPGAVSGGNGSTVVLANPLPGNSAAVAQSGSPNSGVFLPQPNSYSNMSWNPPSQSQYGGFFGNGGSSASVGGQGAAVNTPGTTANALTQTSPDYPTPTALTVAHAFSNDSGGAQPGVLALSPNMTADSLSFVRTPAPSQSCQFVSVLNSNPILFIGGAFLLVYLANYQSKKGRH